MNKEPMGGMPRGASPALRKAVIAEGAKPDYDSYRENASLAMMKAAATVKQQTPEVFDMNNPADRLIWTFLENE